MKVKGQCENHLKDMDEEVFDSFLLFPDSRKMAPEDVIGECEDNVVVVDLSGTEESDEKLRAFLAITDEPWRRLNEEKEDINTALIVDEAPQYRPRRPGGTQRETTERVENLCALGRSYELPMILISQGMARDIGINAAIRRNINTWFVGKVHPLDEKEARELLPGVDIGFLRSLDRGYFYFHGNMNPAPVPLLITFDVED